MNDTKDVSRHAIAWTMEGLLAEVVPKVLLSVQGTQLEMKHGRVGGVRGCYSQWGRSVGSFNHALIQNFQKPSTKERPENTIGRLLVTWGGGVRRLNHRVYRVLCESPK